MARVIVNIVKHNNYEMFASDTPRVVGQKENENGTNLRQNKFLTFTALDACHLVKSATASEITGVKTVFQGILISRTLHIEHRYLLSKS